VPHGETFARPASSSFAMHRCPSSEERWKACPTTKLATHPADLPRQRTVQGDHIEYKPGSNPDAIPPTLCAFANDFESLTYLCYR
jgi:hypothetical protein